MAEDQRVIGERHDFVPDFLGQVHRFALLDDGADFRTPPVIGDKLERPGHRDQDLAPVAVRVISVHFPFFSFPDRSPDRALKFVTHRGVGKLKDVNMG